MEERASGIILRVRPLTETSLIIQWLCQEQGCISTVAKGARRPKSPFGGKLDLFYEAEFSFQRSQRSELHTLREILLRQTRPGLRKNLSSLNLAAYFTILVELGVERETPVPEFYELLRTALNDLARREADAIDLLGFEMKYLTLLGLTPDLSSLPDKTRTFGEACLFAQSESRPPVTLGAREVAEFNRLLRTSIGTALEKLPPQRERAFRGLRIDQNH